MLLLHVLINAEFAQEPIELDNDTDNRKTMETTDAGNDDSVDLDSGRFKSLNAGRKKSHTFSKYDQPSPVNMLAIRCGDRAAAILLMTIGLNSHEIQGYS